ncbi:bifunctional class I SAM-dependent methyltransferase/glycosyltransferase family 2 protein [Omnitrophica bacterium]|nr:bifunctional class I SAM-dependent methyltransferase/glycosyltransferase family 2 protein [Candidatus Omnitrophota bacterium]
MSINTESVKRHFDSLAKDYDKWQRKNAYYYDNIKSLVRRTIPPGSKVLEVGCATGKILASAQPSLGVGIDLSPEMIRLASEKFPQYTFICSSIEDFEFEEKFDYIIMVDLIDHVYDIIDVFEGVYRFCHPETKIILSTLNPWWGPLLSLMEKIRAKMPEGPHNFVEKRNLSKIIETLDFSISRSGYMLLFPKCIPLVSSLVNAIGTRIWGINKLSLVQYMVLKPLPKNEDDLGLSCSVIIPCHNEAGNVEEAVRRIPKMGKETEIIVVDDGSTDETANIAKKLRSSHPNLRLIDYTPNRGKGYAVKQGFDAATKEVLMILDADLSVPPEELPRFFSLLNKGICDFVNGTRVVYPMQEEAMRFLNLFGNKLFALIMTFITKQHLTDTLCGTKALYKKDYKHIKMGKDKWGDFDLLFGAAKLGSRLVEVPVHYMARKAGQSKMKTLRHGLHLLRVCFWGFKELVFRRDSSG